jgi:hypothetical protein
VGDVAPRNVTPPETDASDEQSHTATIRRATGSVPLDGTVDGSPWERATALRIETFPWEEHAEAQSTVVRPLYDDAALYLQYQVGDAHITCSTTEPNGPVYEDSCVEFFAAPRPDRPEYLNLELNACGTVLLRYGPDGGDRPYLSPAHIDRLGVETPFETPQAAESAAVDEWWAAVEIPFDLLAEIADTTIAPRSGTEWTGNFYRCGGRDPQYAVWNPVDIPEPDFHRPDQFGRLRFE